MTIKKDGDKLAGTMSWPGQKGVKLKDLKRKGGDLTFSATRREDHDPPGLEPEAPESAPGRQLHAVLPKDAL